jgi:acetolactate synthase-1/3 small subunit
MEKRKFTISIFSEDRIGVLHSITIIFTRRKLNIDSLNTSESETKGVFRFTLVLTTDLDTAKKVRKQINKLVDVLGAFLHEDEEVVHREIALYKIATSSFYNGNEVEQLLRHHSARIIRVEKEYLVIEKTGWKEETQKLLLDLEPFGVIEFIRSGRIAISKVWTNTHEEVTKYEQHHND